MRPENASPLFLWFKSPPQLKAQIHSTLAVSHLSASQAERCLAWKASKSR